MVADEVEGDKGMSGDDEHDYFYYVHWRIASYIVLMDNAIIYVYIEEAEKAHKEIVSYWK